MEIKEQIDQAIHAYYSEKAVSQELVEAILYSVDGGGKRLRPSLLLILLEGFGIEPRPAHVQVAASVEMIHTGSLIHDDLPAMDNDDYRRGRLTNHKRFNEATAILAGDSLFLDPFGLIAQADLPEGMRLALIQELSQASGAYGMVAGQMLDIAGEEGDLPLAELQAIHAHKTGKLLAFPFVAAAILADQSLAMIEQMRRVGELVGLAFQVRDDILDVTASFEDLGKTPQKDLTAEKSTYPRLMGLEASKTYLQKTIEEALTLLQDIQSNTSVNVTGICREIERLGLNG